jgi:hypothetical protein
MQISSVTLRFSFLIIHCFLCFVALFLSHIFIYCVFAFLFSFSSSFDILHVVVVIVVFTLETRGDKEKAERIIPKVILCIDDLRTSIVSNLSSLYLARSSSIYSSILVDSPNSFDTYNNMGNNQSGPRTKIGKVLTDANIAELSTLSGFTPEQVRDWHAGFLVS